MEKKNVLTKISNIQNEIGGISKNAKNPFYKSNYADLNNIKESLQPYLETQKLMAYHVVTDNHLVTTIFDTESGEFISSAILLSQTDAQKKGSEITYFRRYNLVSMFDLKIEDDDANTTVKKQPQPVQQVKPNNAVNKGREIFLNEKEFELSKKAPIEKITNLLKKYDGKTLFTDGNIYSMTIEQFNSLKKITNNGTI